MSNMVFVDNTKPSVGTKTDSSYPGPQINIRPIIRFHTGWDRDGLLSGRLAQPPRDPFLLCWFKGICTRDREQQYYTISSLCYRLPEAGGVFLFCICTAPDTKKFWSRSRALVTITGDKIVYPLKKSMHQIDNKGALVSSDKMYYIEQCWHSAPCHSLVE